MTTSTKLSLADLRAAVEGSGAAFRRISKLQPAGGVGDKVFPPTYEGGKYALETRVVEGVSVECVVLDSVPSQANRMELALLEAHRKKLVQLPIVTVRFEGDRLRKPFTVSSLEASHRIADALFRDSLCDGVTFRKSAKGRALDDADLRNATGLFRLNPTSLVFGMWDSTGSRGTLGAKFPRALVSEIVGYGVELGGKTSSKLDPAQIMKESGTLYERREPGDTELAWTLDPERAVREKNQPKKYRKEGKPSEANLGNVTPSFKAGSEGGVTLTHALQTTVLSLPALRRLRFPMPGRADSDPAVDTAARTVLAALGLVGATLDAEEGADLRSRCFLLPVAPLEWELLRPSGLDGQRFSLDGTTAIGLFNEALAAARKLDLPWDGEIKLTPSAELFQLVARSQELSAAQSDGGE